MLLASDVQPLFFKSVSLVEAIWTAEDFPSMAEGSTMAAAVSFLANAYTNREGGRAST